LNSLARPVVTGRGRASYRPANRHSINTAGMPRCFPNDAMRDCYGSQGRVRLLALRVLSVTAREVDTQAKLGCAAERKTSARRGQLRKQRRESRVLAARSDEPPKLVFDFTPLLRRYTIHDSRHRTASFCLRRSLPGEEMAKRFSMPFKMPQDSNRPSTVISR